jgi:hypothetical protein
MKIELEIGSTCFPPKGDSPVYSDGSPQWKDNKVVLLEATYAVVTNSYGEMHHVVGEPPKDWRKILPVVQGGTTAEIQRAVKANCMAWLVEIVRRDSAAHRSYSLSGGRLRRSGIKWYGVELTPRQVKFLLDTGTACKNIVGLPNPLISYYE